MGHTMMAVGKGLLLRHGGLKELAMATEEELDGYRPRRKRCRQTRMEHERIGGNGLQGATVGFLLEAIYLLPNLLPPPFALEFLFLMLSLRKLV